MKSISQFIFIDDGVCFNRSMQADNAGWIAVPLGAYMNKTQMQLQLSIPVIQKTGYVYVYLSYESESANWVYFGDLKLSYKRSPVVQTNSYYAFGLSAESWTRIDTKPNKYLYNAGSELNDKTGSYEMFFRSYDPAIGRMSGVDVMAGMYATLSPYQYANNSPVVFNDPTGAWSSVYEQASTGGCGCWRDKGAQDNGGGGVNYNMMTYGAPSMGGSAFGTMGVAPTRQGLIVIMEDAAKVKSGEMTEGQFKQKYGTGNFTGMIYSVTSSAEVFTENVEQKVFIWISSVSATRFVNGIAVGKYTYYSSEKSWGINYTRGEAAAVGSVGGQAGGEDYDGVFESFSEGASKARSNMIMPSGAVAGWGGVTDITNLAVRAEANYVSSFANLRNLAVASKKIKNFGKALGVAGVLASGIESALDKDGFTWGDGAKLGVGAGVVTLAIIGGPFLATGALIYGVADLGFGLFTDASLSDRFGAGIDEMMK